MNAIGRLRQRQVQTQSWLKALLLIAAVVVVALLPEWLSTFNLGRADAVLYYTIAVLSMNLLTGMTGQISLGQGALYGVGAYGVTILVSHAGWAYWQSIPAAVLIAGVAGVVIGIPAARIRGLYLAITTMAVGLVFPELVQRFSSVTGGSNGALVTNYLTPPGWWHQSTARWTFYLTALLTLLCLVLVRNLLRSGMGRSMLATRDHPVVAELFGVRTVLIKITAFGLSAALVGLAGALFVCQQQFAAPSDFTFNTSLDFFVGMAIGGAVSVYGAIVGAAFLEFAPSIITSFGLGQWATPVVYGAIMVAIVYVLPRGIGGGADAGFKRLASRWSIGRVALVTEPSAESRTESSERSQSDSGPPDGGQPGTSHPTKEKVE